MYNTWTEEIPTEVGNYAIALDNVVVDICRLFMYHDHLRLQSIHSTERRTIPDFLNILKRNGGWNTSFPFETGVNAVYYDREKYPDDPPILWNKLNIPSLCYERTDL